MHFIKHLSALGTVVISDAPPLHVCFFFLLSLSLFNSALAAFAPFSVATNGYVDPLSSCETAAIVPAVIENQLEYSNFLVGTLPADGPVQIDFVLPEEAPQGNGGFLSTRERPVCCANKFV